MALDAWSPIRTLRRPEYTGTNRCLPCTALNVCLAGIVAVGLALASLPAGAGVFVVSLGIIYLRGYLVPGTPKLTRQYLPDRILHWFGKNQSDFRGQFARDRRSRESDGAMREADFDLAAVLHQVGILRPCPERDDVCLGDDFRQSWQEIIAAAHDDVARQREFLASSLQTEIDPSKVSLSERDGVLVASVEGTTVGSWLSRAAFVADVAAAKGLAEWINRWEHLDTSTRGSLLARLRIFLAECPSCGDPLTLEEDSGSACCWSQNVTRLQCTGCDALLLEVDEFVFDDGQTEYI